MSRLATKLAKLEARKRAREPRLFYVPGTEIIRAMPFEVWAENTRRQQAELIERCAAYAKELEVTDTHTPANVGSDPLPALPPGQKRPNYIFTTEGNTEYQIETATGRKVAIGRK